MKDVDIHEGIDSTLMILQNRLKAKVDCPSIQIIKEYGNLPRIECYPGQLNQVFMNLLANGIDALEMKRSPWCKNCDENLHKPCDEQSIPYIRIRTEVSDRNWVAIKIGDNGPGMTEAVKQNIFNPFFTTKPVGKGTGLGLAISYQIIVEKHGGKLECVSAPGEGTELVIHIPIRPLV
jgi:signal transduction histidine kinase